MRADRDSDGVSGISFYDSRASVLLPLPGSVTSILGVRPRRETSWDAGLARHFSVVGQSAWRDGRRYRSYWSASCRRILTTQARAGSMDAGCGNVRGSADQSLWIHLSELPI
jgi:hypothetical protein